MKSFTYKIHEKLNKGCNAGNGSGRPAAGQRASRAPQAPGSRRAHNNAGFSLPEIIVAMLIVGIVITPLLTNFAVTARVNAKSLKTKDVTDYAEQIIETLQSYTPDEVDEQFGSDKENEYADTSVQKFLCSVVRRNIIAYSFRYCLVDLLSGSKFAVFDLFGRIGKILIEKRV